MDDASVSIEEVQSPAYATFTVRARALVIDSAIGAAALIALMIFSSATENLRGSGVATVIAIWAFILLYEPVLVAVYGGTLGHRWSNLRVVSDETGRPPNFFVAFARFLLKGILGVYSFVAMGFTRRHQALHDVITGTTVQLRDVAAAQDFEYVNERAPDDDVAMPSLGQRVFVAILYFIAIYFILGGASLVLAPLIVILGWYGGLPGARRRSRPAPTVDDA